MLLSIISFRALQLLTAHLYWFQLPGVHELEKVLPLAAVGLPSAPEGGYPLTGWFHQHPLTGLVRHS